MAKTLDSVTKDFAVFKKKADVILESLQTNATNMKHFRDMCFEGVDEIGRQVGTLKSKGHDGKTIDDFKDDKEVASLLKTIDDFLDKVEKNAQDTQKKVNDLKTLEKEGTALFTDLKKEIDARKQKKDRKVFAIDSKSLPDLEKLHTKVHDYVVESIGATIIDMDGQPGAKIFGASLDKAIQTEVNKGKVNRDAQDQAILDQRGLDLRILGRKLTQVRKLAVDVSDKCGTAHNNITNDGVGIIGDTPQERTKTVKALLKEAQTGFTEMKDLIAPYQRTIAKLNPYDKKTMEQSSDGKKVLGAVAEMEDTLVKIQKKVEWVEHNADKVK